MTSKCSFSVNICYILKTLQISPRPQTQQLTFLDTTVRQYKVDTNTIKEQLFGVDNIGRTTVSESRYLWEIRSRKEGHEYVSVLLILVLYKICIEGN